LALGDSYRGFRIVGTDQTFPELYHGQLKEGMLWKTDFEANIGSKVAEKTGLKIGDSFTGVHGFIEEAGHAHDEHEYIVTGIFEETGTVLDQLILTNIASVWKIHEHHHEHHDDEHIESENAHVTEAEELTVILMTRLMRTNTNLGMQMSTGMQMQMRMHMSKIMSTLPIAPMTKRSPYCWLNIPIRWERSPCHGWLTLPRICRQHRRHWR
jgi:hypothetical protein